MQTDNFAYFKNALSWAHNSKSGYHPPRTLLSIHMLFKQQRMNYSTAIYLRDPYFDLVLQRLATRVSKH